MEEVTGRPDLPCPPEGYRWRIEFCDRDGWLDNVRSFKVVLEPSRWFARMTRRTFAGKFLDFDDYCQSEVDEQVSFVLAEHAKNEKFLRIKSGLRATAECEDGKIVWKQS